jgi:hypothetical protein
MTLKDQILADLDDVFYNTDDFAELVDIESADGDDIFRDVPVIIEFGDGDGYTGADALGTEATMRIRVTDIAIIASGYSVYRGTETWKVLDGQKSEDNLEWRAAISRINR